MTKLPVYLLKAYRFINDDSDVVKNLLSEVDDVAAPLSPPLSEKQRLDDLYVAIMKNYMKNKFNLQPKELDALKITRRILKDFSLNQLKRNINFLINVAGFSKQMVSIQRFSFSCSEKKRTCSGYDQDGHYECNSMKRCSERNLFKLLPRSFVSGTHHIVL